MLGNIGDPAALIAAILIFGFFTVGGDRPPKRPGQSPNLAGWALTIIATIFGALTIGLTVAIVTGTLPNRPTQSEAYDEDQYEDARTFRGR